MRNQLRPMFALAIALTVITGLVYPLAMTGIAAVLFPHQAAGSLIERDGRIVGSALIGQNFEGAAYFHGRPSATTTPDPADSSKSIAAPYNAASSGASNLGPTNAALIDRIKHDVAALQAENPGTPVPAELVTTSGSGLDPDVSPEGALFQVPRIAKARGLDAARLQQLVSAHVEQPLVGLIGEPHVNVLELNLALDDMAGAKR